jgi:PAS domain S-box-containing protein
LNVKIFAVKRSGSLRLLAMGIGALLFPCSLFALDPSKSIFQYNCQSWTRQYGLPANGINAIAQTRDGYLWLGTQKGLVRFDGTEFKSIPLPNQSQFRSQLISSLLGSRDGNLWFGIQMGSIGSFNGSGFSTPTNYPWQDPVIDVLTVKELSDGSCWAGTSKGVVRWIPGAGTNEVWFFNQVPNCTVIQEGSHGAVWLGTSDHGVYILQSGQLTTFPDETIKNESILALAEDSLGQIWIGTPKGLRCYDARFRPKEIPGITSWEEVRALLVDRQGTVWLGTSGSGVACYRGGEVNFLHRTNGLANDYITCLMEDQEGSIWIGTRNGLSQLSDVKLPIFSGGDGLPTGFCHGVCTSSKGGLWVATGRGVSYIGGKEVTNYTADNGLITVYIKFVYEAKNGDVYLINGTRDIEILSNGKVIARFANTNWPTAFAEDSQSVVVSIGGELFRIAQNQMTPYRFKNGKAPPLYWIRNLSSTQDGSILVASVNGVFRLKDGAYEHWTVENGLPDYDVLWASQDDHGVIWAGTSVGIAAIKDNRIQSFTRNNGLFDNVVQTIIPDDHGSIWMNSKRGIFRASRRNLEDFAEGKTSRIECTPFDSLDAVKTIDTTEVEYSGCKIADGRVCFPTPQGVVMINPTNIFKNRVAPPIHIQQVRVNGIELTSSSKAALRPGNGELEFLYAAPSFIAPQKVRFRYWLKGYDTDWVEAGTRRSAFYTNLKPGEYRFRVQASNADGVWNSEGDDFMVQLPPHFYQTIWFRVLYGLVVLATISAIYAWRVKHLELRHRKLKEANELLESKVQQRTAELAEQHNLLRTLIDHLPDNVFVKDLQSRVVINNVAHAQNLGAKDPDSVVGKTDFDFFPRTLAEKFYADEQKLIASGEPYNGEEHTLNCATGQQRWTRTTKVPLLDREGKLIGIAGINRDITERKQWEARLESLHKQLVEASRQAGMAEVATSVLHNVGNVLNSVNVSASLVEEKVKHSAIANWAKILDLFKEHQNELPQFLTEDDRGRKLVGYMEALVKQMEKERMKVLSEISSLVRNLEHIKEIVAMQQTYARVADVSELVKPSELFEDALRMHESEYSNHSIRVARKFSSTPPIIVDRHKVIQILVNLLQNAQYACENKPANERQVTVAIEKSQPDRIKMEVTDTGIGIPGENLTRIFSHGFTTRKNGHGFGLHSGALAAREMGGSLTARSNGSGQGATFTLELPIENKRLTDRLTNDSVSDATNSPILIGVENAKPDAAPKAPAQS